jgi:hypothetical protein
MEALLFSSTSTSVAAFLATATGTSTPLLLLFLLLLWTFGRGHFLLCSCGQDLFLVWAHESRVAHFSTSIPAPVVASSAAAFSLFAFHWFKSYLRRWLLGVKHGIHSRDVLHNVVERCYRLTSQFLNQRLGSFWVALKFELVLVAKTFVAEWSMGFQLVSKHLETFIKSGNTLATFDTE